MTIPKPKTHSRIGAGDIFSTVIANVLIQGCTVIQGILLARLLGPVGRGQFAAVILWPTLFAAIGLFGIGTALARRSATEPDQEALTRSGLVLGFGLALCTSLFCYLLLPFLLKGNDGNLVLMSKWFVPVIFFNHLTLVFLSIDQGAANFKQFNWTRLVVNPVYLALVILIWLTGKSQMFLYVLALMAANLAVLAVRLIKFYRESHFFGVLCPLKPILRDAARYGLADLLSPLYQQIDKVVLLWLLGVRDLGFYSVALAASGVAGSLATALSSVTFGISAQARGQESFDRIAKLFRCSAWVWLMLGTVLAFAMPEFLPLIFGKEFAPAIWPAILLIPGGVFAGQASILEQSLRAQGRAFIGLEARLVGLLAMMPVAWFSSKLLGLPGIPLAYDLAQLLCLVVFCVRTKAHFGLSTISSLQPKWSDFKAIRTSLTHLMRSQSSRFSKSASVVT